MQETFGGADLAVDADPEIHIALQFRRMRNAVFRRLREHRQQHGQRQESEDNATNDKVSGALANRVHQDYIEVHVM
jgi:hypothetical protein